MCVSVCACACAYVRQHVCVQVFPFENMTCSPAAHVTQPSLLGLLSKAASSPPSAHYKSAFMMGKALPSVAG